MIVWGFQEIARNEFNGHVVTNEPAQEFDHSGDDRLKRVCGRWRVNCFDGLRRFFDVWIRTGAKLDFF
jgi:hypothetical protein